MKYSKSMKKTLEKALEPKPIVQTTQTTSTNTPTILEPVQDNRYTRITNLYNLKYPLGFRFKEVTGEVWTIVDYTIAAQRYRLRSETGIRVWSEDELESFLSGNSTTNSPIKYQTQTSTQTLPTGLPSTIAQQDFDEQLKAVNELWKKIATSQAKAFEQLNPNLTPQPHNDPKCTCGTHKTYGLASEPRMHSDWCFFYEAVKSI